MSVGLAMHRISGSIPLTSAIYRISTGRQPAILGLGCAMHMQNPSPCKPNFGNVQRFGFHMDLQVCCTAGSVPSLNSSNLHMVCHCEELMAQVLGDKFKDTKRQRPTIIQQWQLVCSAVDQIMRSGLPGSRKDR